MEVAKELVWPLCLFDLVPGPSERGGSANNSHGERFASAGNKVLVPAMHHTPRCRRLRLYRFVGKMMGIAIRTGTAFDVPFAPFVWKLLTNPLVELYADDLAPLDQGSALQVLTDPDLVQEYVKEVGKAFRAVQNEAKGRRGSLRGNLDVRLVA